MIINSERESLEDIQRINEELDSVLYVQEILDSIPHPAFIITTQRQIVLSNQDLLSMLGVDDVRQIVGERPGDVIGCIHAKKDPNGCSGSSDCQFCGALSTVLTSQIEEKRISQEARLITEKDGHQSHLDLSVTSSPIMINGQKFFCITMMDITSKIRRRVMERVFFHDVLNLAHGLGNTLQISQMNECSEIGGRTLENAKKITKSLLGEIVFQRNLMSAEAGDLNIKTSRFGSMELLKDMVDHMADSKESMGKDMIIDSSSQDFTIESDRSLLGRVLINMIKNALEATRSGEKVEVSCRREKDIGILSVHNSTVMTDDVKAQVWQRSFSTKGENRGIGTYSMKLFTEEYLGGSIDFRSNEREGTTFSVRLPLPQ